jgi:hypothetical protein
MSSPSPSPIEGRRWTFKCVLGWSAYLNGVGEFGDPPWPDEELMPVEEHEAAMFNARHERNFWSWKYERREAECEELAGKLRAVTEVLSKLVTAATPIENGEGGEPEREAFSEAFQEACFALHDLEQGTPTQPNPIGDREQLQELLEAVEAMRRYMAPIPGDSISRLYALADRIRDEQKAGS